MLNNTWKQIQAGWEYGYSAFKRKLNPKRPLSKIGLNIRQEELTRENWIKAVYESVIKDKAMPLSGEEVRKLKQKLGNLLEGEVHLEEDLKVLRMFLELRYSDAFSLETLLEGVSAERYRAVTNQLLSIELSYFERLLDEPIVDVKLLQDRRAWIKRLFRLEIPMESASALPQKKGIRDWIYEFVWLFLQRISLLWGKQDLSSVLKRFGSDYLEFADEVNRLACHFPLVEQKHLRERLEIWYNKGAAYYGGKGLKSAKLTLGKGFSLTEQSHLEQGEKALRQIEVVCERDYQCLREWARFASRSAFVCFLRDSKEGLLEYKRFYKQLLKKERALKGVLWEFRNKVEGRLRHLPGRDYLQGMDALDKQLMAFNERLTDVSENGLIAACFELNKRRENSSGVDDVPGLSIDKVQTFLMELSSFIASHQPLLDWLLHSCYCVSNTERVINYEMNRRIEEAGGADTMIKYNLTAVDGVTDYVLRQLSHLLQDKTALLKLHPDKNQVLNELGKYGGELVVAFWEDASALIQRWQYSQWAAAAPAGTLQLTWLGESKPEEEKEDVLPELKRPKYGISIEALGLKARYIERIEALALKENDKRMEARTALTKHTRAQALIPPSSHLYDGPDDESVRELWQITTAVRQVWNDEARESDRRVQELEKITGKASAETAALKTKINEANARKDEANARKDEANARIDAANARIDEANARIDAANAKVGMLQDELNSHNRIMANGLLEMSISAVRAGSNPPESLDELKGMVISSIYTDPQYGPFLQILTKAGWTEEMLMQSLEALLEKENELSKAEEEKVVLLVDGLTSLSVSSSGEGLLLEKENKPNKKKEEAIASPQEETLSPREAKRRSGFCSWQFFDEEAVQLADTIDLFASLSVSSSSSNTP